LDDYLFGIQSLVTDVRVTLSGQEMVYGGFRVSTNLKLWPVDGKVSVASIREERRRVSRTEIRALSVTFLDTEKKT